MSGSVFHNAPEPGGLSSFSHAAVAGDTIYVSGTFGTLGDTLGPRSGRNGRGDDSGPGQYREDSPLRGSRTHRRGEGQRLPTRYEHVPGNEPRLFGGVRRARPGPHHGWRSRSGARWSRRDRLRRLPANGRVARPETVGRLSECDGNVARLPLDGAPHRRILDVGSRFTGEQGIDGGAQVLTGYGHIGTRSGRIQPTAIGQCHVGSEQEEVRRAGRRIGAGRVLRFVEEHRERVAKLPALPGRVPREHPGGRPMTSLEPTATIAAPVFS